MKYKLPILLAIIFNLVSFANCETNEWDVSQTMITTPDGKATIPGSGKRAILMNVEEVEIVDDADATNGKAISFSGMQAKPISLTGGKFVAVDSVLLKVKLKPYSGMKGEGTVLCHSGAYELRVGANGSEVRFYVYYKEQTPALQLKANLKVSEWNAVEASVKGSEVTLKVNDESVTATIPDGGSLFPTEVYYRIGRVDEMRPYKGLLADLLIAEPAE